MTTVRLVSAAGEVRRAAAISALVNDMLLASPACRHMADQGPIRVLAGGAKADEVFKNFDGG